MKKLVLIFTIVALIGSVDKNTPAAAQSILLPPSFSMPRTIPWTDGRGGDVLGTATISDNKVYLRNTKGEHIATITSEKGRAIYYDPSGNVIARTDIPGLPPDVLQ